MLADNQIKGTRQGAASSNRRIAGLCHPGQRPGYNQHGERSEKWKLRQIAAAALAEAARANPAHPTSEALRASIGDCTPMNADTLADYLGDLSKNTGHLKRQVSVKRLVNWYMSGDLLGNHPTGLAWADAISMVHASKAAVVRRNPLRSS